jgi:hypothetical protein
MLGFVSRSASRMRHVSACALKSVSRISRRRPIIDTSLTASARAMTAIGR